MTAFLSRDYLKQFVRYQHGRDLQPDQGFYLGEHGWFDKRWMHISPACP